MIFLIRFFTATFLFAFLGKANIWLNPISNIILAIGYRFFLILSPLFSKTCGKYSLSVCLLLSAVGAAFFCFKNPYAMAIGAILVGIGFSVSGYLIKSEAAETPSGAAYNKIALNAGSLLSGVLLLFSFYSRNIFFSISAIILLFLCSFCFSTKKEDKEIKLSIPKTFSKKRWIGWLLVGVAIGIKFFGVLSVLPQHLLAHYPTLPPWYGAMLFINSGLIILLQIPIIHWIANFKKNNLSFKITLFFMLLGMLFIAFPQLFRVDSLIGAVIWTVALSLIECCASYLDVEGSKAGFLLVKETSVGLGAGLTVFFSRYFSQDYSSILIGLSGILAIIGAALLLYNDIKNDAIKN